VKRWKDFGNMDIYTVERKTRLPPLMKGLFLSKYEARK
jgi:hypothetical protein